MNFVIICEFGIVTFGYNQAQIYLMKLHKCFLNIAQNPSIGRDASGFSEGLKRFVYEFHSISYHLMKTPFFRAHFGIVKGLSEAPLDLPSILFSQKINRIFS